MKITFNQVDNQHVNIMCGEKKIGHIFSPGGTGESTPNAIQICGFEDAYDLWGCGVFSEKIETFIPHTEENIANIKKRQSECSTGYMVEYFEAMLKKGGVVETTTVYKKDIQLLFKEYDNAGHDNHQSTECYGCYNKKCSCDSKEKGAVYNLKRSNDADFKKKLETKEEKQK